MRKLRVLVADDHAVVRKGLEVLLAEQDDFEVVATAADGKEAVEMALLHCPDVIVMDLSMPIKDGLEATREVMEKTDATKILAISAHDDKSFLRQALEAGAKGYVLKRSNSQELITAVRAVASGDVYLDPNLSSKIISSILGNRNESYQPPSPRLTERETEVMTLIAQGFSNKEIAEKLSISVKTVETHRARSMEKLSLENRADIVRYALRQGWLDHY